MMSPSRGTVLIVEDDAGIAELEQMHLERAGFEGRIAATLDEAWQLLRADGIDLVLLDYQLPGDVDGLDFYNALRAEGFDPPVILVTGFSNEATAIQALRAGVRDFITKSAEYLEYLPEAAARVLGQVRTERQLAEAEQALRAREQELTDFVENALVGMHWLSPEGIILWANRADYELLGYRRDEYVGRSLTQFHADPQVLRHILQRLERGEELHDYEARLRHRDGSLRHVLLSSSPHCVDGRLVHSRCFTRDITERKQAEAERSRLAAIVESTTDFVLIADAHLHLVYANGAARQALGIGAHEDVTRLLLADLFAAAMYERLLAEVLPQTISDGKWTGEIPLQSRMGKRIPTELVCIAHGDGTGKPEYFSVTARDITERKRAEKAIQALNAALEQRVQERTAALHASEAYNRSIVESSPDCLHIMSLDGALLYLGPTGRRIMEVDDSCSLDNVNWLTFWKGDDLVAAQRALETARAGGRGLFEGHCPTMRGTPRWWDVAITPILGEDGKPEKLLAVSRDITERKQIEHALSARTAQLEAANTNLEAARAEAMRANRAKSEFLSRMSHELRTPLNSILGFGQLLENSALSEKDSRRVGQIVKAGRHLLELINEVLDISRIEAGAMRLSLEPILVRTAIDEVLDLLQPLAHQREITLRREPGACDGHVRADVQRLKQVLLNLLSNAIKFNRAGGEVVVACEERSPQRLCLAVRDTGVGLSPEQMQHLFEPFNRLGAEQKGIEGTGLGLALTRRLVEAMDGTLTVTSAVGQGSTFAVELLRTEPARSRPAAGGASVGLSAAPHARTLLYVEDNLANLNLIEDILSDRPGIRLLTAMQAGLGLELVRQHRPDLVLLDLHLPDFPGEEFLRRLRGDPSIRNSPVVVLSADAIPQQVERLRALGARAYLTKPLDVRRFLEVLDRVLHAGGAHGDVEPEPGPDLDRG